MTTYIEFWERVHFALDERRDPLEDSDVQDAIASEPQLLDELLLLRSRLDALPVTRERGRFLRAAAAAVIAIALGVAAFRLVRAPSTDEPDIVANPPHGPSTTSPDVAIAMPNAAIAKNEILDFELSITTERPGERDTVVIDRSGTRTTRELIGEAREHSTLITEVWTPRGR